MEKLNFEQMEKKHGGDGLGCAASAAVYIGSAIILCGTGWGWALLGNSLINGGSAAFVYKECNYLWNG